MLDVDATIDIVAGSTSIGCDAVVTTGVGAGVGCNGKIGVAACVDDSDVVEAVDVELHLATMNSVDEVRSNRKLQLMTNEEIVLHAANDRREFMCEFGTTHDEDE